MKKIFLFSVLLGCFCPISIEAATFTNDENNVPDAYKNYEYQKNGQAFTAIGADRAYTGSGGGYTGFSGQGVTVAIVDSGVFSNHEDLEHQKTDTGDKFNLFPGIHGTHVAGIIGAEKNNTEDYGMHGVAYNAKLLPFSTKLLGSGGCEDETRCMDPLEAYEELAADAFDDVLIVNNSWGTNSEEESDIQARAAIAQKLTDKGKLLVAAAGNETKTSPSSFPAKMAAYNSNTALNLISVVAYNPAQKPSDPDFIAGYSNLADGAQKWSLAAPGTIYSTIPYGSEGEKFSDMSGTSMAAPMVSGAAALVAEAFPYMDGKQIADVLFSTAFKKEDLDTVADTRVSPYMIQVVDETVVRALFFTDNVQGVTYEEAVARLQETLHLSCGTILCNQVTFEDVFGQGLLNVGDAVKGLKYLDADRLTAENYDEELGQFFYTVDTKGYDSEWANNIGEKKNSTETYSSAGVGLKKTGEGTLTLSGNNTFTGASHVEGGSLVLTGSLTGAVTVKGGAFTLNAGSLGGNLSVDSAGTAQISSGTLSGNIENKGTFSASGGSVTGNAVNTGTFDMSNGFNVSGSFSNKNILNMQNMSAFSATLNNEGTLSVSGSNILGGTITNASSGKMTLNPGSSLTLQPTEAIDNNGILTGRGTIDGTVNNNATGSIVTSINAGTFNSSGKILLASETGGSAIAAMHADTVNITGGKIGLENKNIVYENGKTYTVIDSASITAFENFEEQTNLTDFIVATTFRDGNRINTKIDYLRISENSEVASFLPEEKKVLEIVDKMFIDEKQSEFGWYYNYSGDELKKQINSLRSKAKPVHSANLPLTKVMSSQVNAHLFANSMLRDASSSRPRFVPMQQYRGRYYRGRSGGNGMNGNKVWGQFLGGRVREDGDKNFQQGKTTTKSVGAMFGADHEYSERLLIGWTAGVARANLVQDNNEIHVNDYRVGLYTGSRFGQVTFNTLVMGGIQQYKTSRNLLLGDEYRTSKGDFNGYSAEIDVNLGYDFMRVPYRDYSFYLRSYLGANASYVYQGEYKEKTSSFLALGIDDVHNTSFSVSPGITLGYMFSQDVITLDIGYQRLLNGDALKTSAYFLTDATKTRFSSVSAETDKDFLNIVLGFKKNLSRRLQFNMSGSVRESKDTEAFNFSASLAYSF